MADTRTRSAGGATPVLLALEVEPVGLGIRRWRRGEIPDLPALVEQVLEETELPPCDHLGSERARKFDGHRRASWAKERGRRRSSQL